MEDTQYPIIKKHLEKGLLDCGQGEPIYLHDGEIDSLIQVVVRQLSHNANVGIHSHRLEYTSGTSDVERAFAEEWMKENEPISWSNNGFGILSALLTKQGDVVYKPTNRERAIVATVVQWLGSSIGQAFMERCLESVGRKIVEIKK